MPAVLLHEQTKQRIEEGIRSGLWRVGQRLPPEEELCRTMHVSRQTLRLAFQRLEQEGIISRQRKVGTFVIGIPKEGRRIMSFTEQVRARGLNPITEVDTSLTGPIMASQAEEWVWRSFILDHEQAQRTLLYRICRRRYAQTVSGAVQGQRQLLAVQTVYLLASEFRDLDLSPGSLAPRSLFDIYEEYHRYPMFAEETLSARAATDAEVVDFGLQDLPPRAQFVYERRRATFDSRGRPLEVLISIDSRRFWSSYRYRIVQEG